MAVTTTNVFNVYTSTGASNTFAVTFYLQEASWLVVKVNGVITGAWSAIINMDQRVFPGGNVTLTGATIPGGQTVRIERHTPLNQLDVYQPYTPFPAQTAEFDWDKAICITQELAYQLSLISIPGISLATAGMFLSNDGNTIFWADVLPRPYVTGSVLGATSPTTLAWVAGGGGGGGIDTIGPTTTPTPNAAIISGLGSNVLQLAVADGTDAGLVSTVAQDFAGEKHFLEGAATSVFDIRNYGAVPNDPTFDNIGAIEAAIAAWTTQGAYPFGSGFTGGVFIPAGAWYFSRPICIPQTCRLYGEGRNMSQLITGIGTPTTPANVQGFGGPALYGIKGVLPAFPGNRQYPTYGASLATGPGQSMDLNPASNYVRPTLSDSFPWSLWWTYFATQFGFRCRVKWTDPYAIGPKSIMASMGPSVNQPYQIPGDNGLNITGADCSFGLFMYGIGGSQYLRAYIRTYDDDLIFLDSLAVTNNTNYHVEVDYTGAAFLLYVNGVLQSSQLATGQIKKMPWEAVIIGNIGNETNATFLASVSGSIDCMELSSQPFHTGSNFTPPTTKPTWTANTLWLCNFDQGQGLHGNQPFFLAQTTCTEGGAVGYSSKQYSAGAQPPTYNGPNLHYVRGVPTGDISNVSPDIYVEDLAVQCNLNTAGFITWGGWRTTICNTLISAAVNYGIKIFDPLAFFGICEGNYVSGTAGIGIQYQGTFCNYNQTIGCAISVWCNGGANGCQDQPVPANSFICFIAGDPLEGNFQACNFVNCVNDEENNFTAIPQRCALLVMGAGGGAFVFQGNTWTGNQTTNQETAPVIYLSVPDGGSTHIGDSFWKSPFAPTIPYITRQNNQEYLSSPPAVVYGDGNISLVNCSFNALSYERLIPPLSNRDDWISVSTPMGLTNQQGFSSTNELARNLTGEVVVSGTSTTGTVVFDTDELSTDYNLSITYQGFEGSAPAAGSNRIEGYTRRLNGFDVEVETAPGAGSQVEFTWQLSGAAQPIFKSFAPAIPSTVSPNPFVAVTPHDDFAIAVTLVPAVGNAIPWVAATETIVEAGSAAPNFWQINLVDGQPFGTLGSSTATSEAFVSSGVLYSILNPGSHRVGMAWKHGFGYMYIDSGIFAFYGPGSLTQPDPGTQQSPLRWGEHSGGTQSLVSATLQNGRLARHIEQTQLSEVTVGPGSQPVSAFFGDDFLVGFGSTAGSGGAATQIASARYGSKYYYMAVKNSSVAAPGLGSISLPDVFWNPWGSHQLLENLCVCLGFNDVSEGVLATDAMAGIQNIFEGGQAYAFWKPTAAPTLSTAAEIISQNAVAWCQIAPPTSNIAGVSTLTLNGTPLSFPFITDNHTTCLNIQSVINSTPAFSGVLTCTVVLTQDLPGGYYYPIILAAAIGSAGNGIPVLTDGKNGTATYPAPSTQGGVDYYIHINGFAALSNWAGSSAATLAATVAAANANGSIAAIGTATNTGTQLKFTKTARGAAGNSVTVQSDFQGPDTGWVDQNNTPVSFLRNGYEGALTSVSNVMVLCNVPPFGQSSRYTAPREAQRAALNTAIANYVVANPTITLADLDATLRDGGTPINLNPAYVYSDNLHLNDAGYTAMFGVLNPLLP